MCTLWGVSTCWSRWKSAQSLAAGFQQLPFEFDLSSSVSWRQSHRLETHSEATQKKKTASSFQPSSDTEPQFPPVWEANTVAEQVETVQMLNPEEATFGMFRKLYNAAHIFT